MLRTEITLGENFSYIFKSLQFSDGRPISSMDWVLDQSVQNEDVNTFSMISIQKEAAAESHYSE